MIVAQELCENTRIVGDKGASVISPVLLMVSRILAGLGLRVFIIGARSVMLQGVNLGRETQGWDIFVDRPFTPELRDRITEELRSRGFKVQWRKWGLLVENGEHIVINHAPLTFDEEFVRRSRVVSGNVLLPPIEDIVVMKLMSGERKDIVDVKRILAQTWHRVDEEYLYRRAWQAGLEKELEKMLRRLGLE